MHPILAVDRGTRLTCAVITAVVLSGCAGSGGARPAAVNRDVITTEELAGVFVADLYQAVERLRPQWLISRGMRSLTGETVIAVVVDGNYLGGVETLRQITVPSAVDIRYLDGAEATATVPGITGSGRIIESAILVRLGRGR